MIYVGPLRWCFGAPNVIWLPTLALCKEDNVGQWGNSDPTPSHGSNDIAQLLAPGS